MKTTALAAAVGFATVAFGRPLAHRGLIDDAAGQTYDYIVVGCGVSGLVVSARLTEDPNVSVLCLEAGSL